MISPVILSFCTTAAA